MDQYPGSTDSCGVGYYSDSISAILVFGGKKELPETVSYLGTVLPAAIMIILVVFCLRNTILTAYPFGLPELLSMAVVIVVH